MEKQAISEPLPWFIAQYVYGLEALQVCMLHAYKIVMNTVIASHLIQIVHSLEVQE